MDGDRVLAARYRLIEKLVEGGMGTVWRAEHLTLRTQIAVKLMDPTIADTREAFTRFEREAQAAAELRSTHIVQILDYGVDAGTPYIAMELLEGESLAALLLRTRRLTPDRTARLLAQVARALSRAHEKGVVHRDLKPDNIFIAREGEDEVVKVLDFGIAKKLDRLMVDPGVKTHTGSVLGSPFYMSPEQVAGSPSIDQRSDIWSFAVVAYECLTGIRPFERDTLGAVFTAISHEPLPVPSQVAAMPRGFDGWFARAAARNPAIRYPCAADAAQQLRIACDSPIEVLTTTAVIPTPHLRAANLFANSSNTAPPSAVTVSGLPHQRVRSWQLVLVPAFTLVLLLIYVSWHGARSLPASASVPPSVQLQPMSSASASSLTARSVGAQEPSVAPQVSSSSAIDIARMPRRVVRLAPRASPQRVQSGGAPTLPVAGLASAAPAASAHPDDDVFVGF